ncbi:MAG: hypothetical protein ACI9OO_000349 [Bacteroidia bacterium]
MSQKLNAQSKAQASPSLAPDFFLPDLCSSQSLLVAELLALLIIAL